MKKFLCLMFALATVFCFAGCENGKCDDCGKTEDETLVAVVDALDGDPELCAECAYKRALKEGLAD